MSLQSSAKASVHDPTTDVVERRSKRCMLGKRLELESLVSKRKRLEELTEVPVGLLAPGFS